MANPFYIEPANPLQALMIGGQAYDQATKRAREAENEQLYKEVAPLIASEGLTPNALSRLFAAGPAGAPLLTAAAALTKARTDASGVYGTPIWGIDQKTGQPAIGTFNKQGGFVPVATPNFTPTPPAHFIDTGLGTAIVSGKYNPGGAALPGPAVPPTAAPPVGVPPSGAPPAAVAPELGSTAPIVPRPVQTIPQGNYVPKDVQGKATQEKVGAESGEKLANYGHAQAALDNSVASLDRLAAAARELRNHPGLGGITGLKGMFPNIPGGQAANAQALLDSLSSKTAFATLQAMRDASKTGGALGQVSNYEEQLLRDNIAALGRAQNLDQYKAELGKIISFAEGAKRRVGQAFMTDYGRLKMGGASAAAPTPAAPSVVDWQTYFGAQ